MAAATATGAAGGRTPGRLERGQAPDGRATLSILQACARVGVSRRTIYNWLKSGRLTYCRTIGGSVRIYEDSLWREPAANDWDQRRQGANFEATVASAAGGQG